MTSLYPSYSKPEHIPHKAVFHLHGQRTGFILLNTEQEVIEHSQRLGALFKTAGEGKAWIVVGYSGESDPVFTHLADVCRVRLRAVLDRVS